MNRKRAIIKSEVKHFFHSANVLNIVLYHNILFIYFFFFFFITCIFFPSNPHFLRFCVSTVHINCMSIESKLSLTLLLDHNGNKCLHFLVPSMYSNVFSPIFYTTVCYFTELTKIKSIYLSIYGSLTLSNLTITQRHVSTSCFA